MVITTSEDFTTLRSRMEDERHLYVEILSDIHYHRVENNVLCVGIVFPDTFYTVSVFHRDAPTFEVEKTDNSISYTMANLTLFENSEKPKKLESYYTPYVVDTQAIFGNMRDANRVIPLATWSDVIFRGTRDLPIEFPSEYHQELLSVLQEIENEGIAVDPDVLSEHFDPSVNRSHKGDLVYSEYNPFTATGRPSNRFGGINFSALNKHDGTRDSFVSRYENGVLVQLDFQAYHLRLIADEFNIKVPEHISLHEEFARHYFDTDEITPELYEESKKKTFEIMYGNGARDYGIGLFKQVNELKKLFSSQTLITLPNGRETTIVPPNPSKMFNYFVQSLEVVKTIPKLRAVLELTKDTNNHLTLYTYDSILLDMEEHDEAFINSVKECLVEDGKFPVRVYNGKTYGEIIEV